MGTPSIHPPKVQYTKQIVRPLVINFILYVTGINAAQSKINFQQWLDNTISAMSSNNPFVTDANGAREPGLYHQLLGHEFDQITSLLSLATARWGNDCAANNCTCGHLYYVRKGGHGNLTITCQVWGPFQ